MPNTKQYGFVALPLLGWAAIAAGGVILALGIALKVQSARLDARTADLEACQSRYAETLKLVEKSNKAVSELAETAAKRARNAKAALAKARQEAGSLDSEIARLRAAKPSDCAAAVATVRQGLKP